MHRTLIRRNQRIVLRYYKPNKHLHPEEVCMLSSATVLLVFEGKWPFFMRLNILRKTVRSKSLNQIVKKLTLYWLKYQYKIKKNIFLMINNMNSQNLMSKKTMNRRVLLHFKQLKPISNEELSNLILTLNTQQRKIFNEVQDWTWKKLRAMNCKKNVILEPLRLFITRGAGVGRSYLMKIICLFFIKTMNLYPGLSINPMTLFLLPLEWQPLILMGKLLIRDLAFHCL